MAKKAFIYDGTNWIDIAQSTADLSKYSDLTLNQPTFRNAFINANFAINQRNDTNVITAGAALRYHVDRWYIYCTGGNMSASRQTFGTAPNKNFFRFTNSADATGFGLGQRIEAANSFHFSGRSATVSVGFTSSVITTLTWTAYYANTADNFGTLASPTRTQIATGTWTVNSTLTRYSATMNIPAAATTGIEVVFTAGPQAAFNTSDFYNPQFEVGSVATTPEYRPIGTELALCQRYYWRKTGEGAASAGATFGSGVCTTGTTSFIEFYFPVQMRAIPTMAISSGNLVVTDSVTYNLGSVSIASQIYNTPTTGRVSINHAGTGTAFRPHVLAANTTTSAAWVDASAEL